MHSKELKKIHQQLIKWYQKNKRDLPWRRSKNPYHIWLSEIMLQQTRVETVIPYFYKFTKKYPTIADLANAPIDSIREDWAGLGYYTRAANLHKTAQLLCKENNFPSSIEELRKLPGIGAYTSAAIASIAFNQSHAAIDGNLERVLARLIALKKIAKGAVEISEIANHLVQYGMAGEVNQALMDISATICFVQKPTCGVCPLQNFCKTKKENLSDQIPVKKQKKAIQEIHSRGVLFLYRSPKNEIELLAVRRPKGVWLSEMWDIPWWIENEEISDSPLKAIKFNGRAKIKRTITHHKISFQVDYVFLKRKLTPAEISKKFHFVGKEFRWQSIEQDIPRPTKKIIMSAIRKSSF